MSKINRSGELEESVRLPFINPKSVFGLAHDVNSAVYVAAVIIVEKTDPQVHKLNVMRLMNNLVDPRYGEQGIAEVEFDIPLRYIRHGVSTLPQKDGGLVLVADHSGLTGDTVALLARFDRAGQLDETFGNAGKVVHVFPEQSKNQALQSTTQGQESEHLWSLDAGSVGGAISQATSGLYYPYKGYYSPEEDTGRTGFIARFHSNGEIDTRFGQSGVVNLNPPGSVRGMYPSGVAELADGKIITYGVVLTRAGKELGAVARFLSTGQPDLTFAEGGYLLMDLTEVFPFQHQIGLNFKDIVAGRGSSLVCSGYMPMYGVVAHLDSEGGNLPSFNNGRPVTFSLPDTAVLFYSVALQDDGKIVAGGRSGGGYLIVRFNADGRVDDTFGDQGVISGDGGTTELILIDRGLINAAVYYFDAANPVRTLQLLQFRI